jgi:hypothetical protein
MAFEGRTHGGHSHSKNPPTFDSVSFDPLTLSADRFALTAGEHVQGEAS